MGKILKKIAPIALSLAAPYAAPALGITSALGTSALGAGLGALGSKISGGNVLTGALGGALSGGLGGLSGGANSILGSAPSSINWTSAAPGYSLGTTQLAGSGIRGALGGGGLSSLTSGAGGSGLGSLARIGGTLYSQSQEDDAMKKAQRAMLGSIQPYQQMGNDAQKQLAGNLSAGFNPGDLTSDPSYQFRLKQGMDALNKTLAAQGMGQSGAAMKAAQDYGQGFASTEYGNAYDRWLQQNQQLAGLGGQGLETAAASGNIMGSGLLKAAENKNKRISEILSGLGI